MEKKEQSKITDFHSFWKIIVLVCVAIIAEGVILWAATSDMAVDWTYETVIAPRVVAEEINAEANTILNETVEIGEVEEVL